MDSKSERWRYIWNQNGTLKEVRPPGGGDFAFDALFTYDALGRRLSKDAIGITCWLWNGNVPLHEWTPSQRRNEQGEIEENQKDLRTWLFEEESFVPLALFQDGKAYSIVTDHLGTPVEAYNEQGEEVWYRRLDMNGKVIEERSIKTILPTRITSRYRSFSKDSTMTGKSNWRTTGSDTMPLKWVGIYLKIRLGLTLDKSTYLHM